MAPRPDPRMLRSFGPAAALTLATGALMTAAGYLFKTDGWAVAGWVMTPAGPLISAAFSMARRAREGAQDPNPKSRARHIATLVLGMPSPGGDVGTAAAVATSVVTLLAGAVMVIAGYAIATWNPLSVPPIFLAGGVIITAAFVIADRAGKARAKNSFTATADDPL